MQVTAHLIYREKLGSPLGRHYGLAIRDLLTGRVRVFDLQSNSRRRSLTLEQFAEGRLICWEKYVDGAAAQECLRRLRQLLAVPRLVYDFFKRNCEHFARYAFSGESRSYQIEFALAISLVVLVLWASRSQ